jgi:hypothetical protein
MFIVPMFVSVFINGRQWIPHMSQLNLVRAMHCSLNVSFNTVFPVVVVMLCSSSYSRTNLCFLPDFCCLVVYFTMNFQ